MALAANIMMKTAIMMASTMTGPGKVYALLCDNQGEFLNENT
jgi:hypothetical protein